MKNKCFYLKEQVKFEPIIFYWPAWPQMIAPSNAGLYLKNRYLKILESYLETPDIHHMAANDPKLQGGPFVNIHPSQKESVQKIYFNIKQEAAILIELAEAFSQLNTLLLNEAKGYALEAEYVNNFV